jgi:preprotein translocase subunit SecE
MGRLIRKKPNDKAKKKSTDSHPVSSHDQNAVASNGALEVKTERESAPRKSVSQPQITKTSKPLLSKLNTGFMAKSVQFLREVKVELKKVTWPTRKQTVGSTVVVLILVLIISFFLGAVDIGLSSLIRVVLQ